jgi:HK97 family phage portal protein
MRVLGREIRTFNIMPPWITPWSSSGSSGVPVDRGSSLGLAAVWACVRLLSGAISRMPVDTLIDIDETSRPYPQPRWLRRPILDNPNFDWVEHVSQVMVSLLLDGNMFVGTPRDNSNDVSELFVLDPQAVEITGAVASPGYKVRTTSGQRVEFGPDEILHRPLLSFPGSQRGVSPVEACRMVFGVGISSQEYAGRFFSQDATPPGYLAVPAGTKTTVEQLKTDWEGHHAGADNWHRPGVLTGGTEWKSISLTHEQAQFLEQRAFSDRQFAMLFGVPPHMIGDVERSTSWGTGIEQQGIGFVTYSLNDYLVLLERAYGSIVPNPNSYLRFNRNSLLRGDAETRAKFYGELFDRGVINADWILAKENEPPLPDGKGKTYFVSTQVQSVEEARKPPAPPPAPFAAPQQEAPPNAD